MHYNSAEHFLRTQTDAITARLAEGQAAAGGHYARLTPAARQATAAADAHQFIAALLAANLAPDVVQAGARAAGDAGVPIDDLLRMTDETQPRLLAFITAELADQPELGADLVRRIRDVNARFRSNVTAVKLEQAIARLRPRTPRP